MYELLRDIRKHFGDLFRRATTRQRCEYWLPSLAAELLFRLSKFHEMITRLRNLSTSPSGLRHSSALHADHVIVSFVQAMKLLDEVATVLLYFVDQGEEALL